MANQPADYLEDMSMYLDETYVAKEDFTLVPLYGAELISVIVPEGVDVKIDECLGFDGLGHNSLYFMDNYEVKGGEFDLEAELFEARAKREMFPHLRKLTASEMQQWRGRNLQAMSTTASDLGDEYLDETYVAKEDFTLVPLYGAPSVTIIVPEGINVTVNPSLPFGGYGHNRVYQASGNQGISHGIIVLLSLAGLMVIVVSLLVRRRRQARRG